MSRCDQCWEEAELSAMYMSAPAEEVYAELLKSLGHAIHNLAEAVKNLSVEFGRAFKSSDTFSGGTGE